MIGNKKEKTKRHDPFANEKEKAQVFYDNFKEGSLKEEIAQAIELDNTHREIIYEYINTIRRRKKDYELELLFRKLFLTHLQIKQTERFDIYGKSTMKTILLELFFSISSASSTKEMKTKFNQHFKKYPLNNPYYVQLKKVSNKKIYHYDNKEYFFNMDIRPRYAFQITTDEEDLFKFMRCMFYINKTKILENIFIFSLSFKILKELIEKKVDIEEILTITRIIIIADVDMLPYYLVSVTDTFNLDMISIPEIDDKGKSIYIKNKKDEICNRENILSNLIPDIKVHLFNFLKKIINSQCIQELLCEAFPNAKKENIKILDDTFIEYVEENTEFKGLYNDKVLSTTNFMINRIIINQVTQLDSDKTQKDIFNLLHIGLFTLSLISEVFGSFACRYLISMTNNRVLLEYFDENKNIINSLFNNEIKSLSLRQCIFILEPSSYETSLSSFKDKLSSYEKSSHSNKEIQELITANDFFFDFFKSADLLASNELYKESIEYSSYSMHLF